MVRQGAHFQQTHQESQEESHRLEEINLAFIEATCPLSRKLKTYVRPILLYGAPIWNTTSNTNIRTLQAVETIALRIILSKKRQELSNERLYEETELTRLSETIKKHTKQFYTESVESK